MPTAAKMIAAIILAIIGYMTAEATRPLLPDGMATGWLNRVVIVIPAICGWRVIGRMVGRGYNVAFSMGLYAVTVSVFFVLLTFAIAEMLSRSMRKLYDGPMEAIVRMFEIFVEYGSYLLSPMPILYLLVGAALVGPIAEYAHRKWN